MDIKTGIPMAMLTFMQISSTAEADDFSFLDHNEFQQKYVLNNNQIRFYVGGIRCGKCVRKLEDLPLTIPGLKQLRVEMAENLAFAEIDSTKLTLAGFIYSVTELLRGGNASARIHSSGSHQILTICQKF